MAFKNKLPAKLSWFSGKRKCRKCGKMFNPKVYNAESCSRKCSKKFHNDKDKGPNKAERDYMRYQFLRNHHEFI